MIGHTVNQTPKQKLFLYTIIYYLGNPGLLGNKVLYKSQSINLSIQEHSNGFTKFPDKNWFQSSRVMIEQIDKLTDKQKLIIYQ